MSTDQDRSIQEIIETSDRLDKYGLLAVKRHVSERLKTMDDRARKALARGQRVRAPLPDDGGTVTGTITRIGRDYVDVDLDDGKRRLRARALFVEPLGPAPRRGPKYVSNADLAPIVAALREQEAKSNEEAAPCPAK